MTRPTQQHWCHACGKIEDFAGGWFALYIAPYGECVLARVDDDEFASYREEVFACGQLSALVLVERYLHTGTFDPPVPATPTPASEPFDTLT